jgi:alpha-glucoside transport system permease protein
VIDLFVTVLTVVGVIAVAAGIFVGLNRLIDFAPIVWQDRIRPWLFVMPALVFLGVGLLWPTVRTVYLSVRGGRDGDEGFTFDNYSNVFSDPRHFNVDNWADIFTSRLFLLAALLFFAAVVYAVFIRQRSPGTGLDLRAPLPSVAVIVACILLLLAIFSTLRGTLFNNLWWVATVAGLSTILGLVLAVLADRSKGEALAKSLIFMPMAISFVGAAVIWRYVYYRNTPREDIGLLNEGLVKFGFLDEPIDFYTSADLIPWNNFFLMIIMIWIQTGFALVIISAALKGVPTDTVEASRIDGASELQTLWRVVIPQIRLTIIVVLTTLVATVMKVFDLIKATTNGRSNTDVLANAMYENLRDSNFTMSATFATIIVLLILPIMLINVRRSGQHGNVGGGAV